MMTGIGVHHQSEWMFTLVRNDRSRWTGIRTFLVSLTAPPGAVLHASRAGARMLRKRFKF
jgi:hypothetical protein